MENAARSVSEENLKMLMRKPECVPALVEQLRGSPSPQVRHLAAVVLRKRILTHWGKLPPELKAGIKRALQEGMLGEPEMSVRKGVAHVIGAVAKLALPSGEWNDLLEFLGQATRSPHPEHREVALTTFASLTETMGPMLESQYATLGALFSERLGDENVRVRMAAITATGTLLELVADDIAKEPGASLVKGLVPGILSAARMSLAQGQEDAAGKAIEIMDELVEVPSSILKGQILPDSVSFMVEVARNEQCMVGVRNQALQLVATIAEYRTKQIVKAKLVAPILNAIFPLASAKLDTLFERGESDEHPLHEAAAQNLDHIANVLPSREVLPAVVAHFNAGRVSPNPAERRDATKTLAIVIEGCAESLRHKTQDLLQPLLQLLRDPDQEVRGVAAYTVAQAAEHLQPEITEHHAQVLPLLFGILGEGPTLPVLERTLYSIDAWLEGMEADQVVPYVQPILQVMSMALASNSSPTVQEIAVSCVASAASVAGIEGFRPFLPELIPRVVSLLELTDAAQLQVRARALECIGMLLCSEGARKDLEGIIPGTMKSALMGFEMDEASLREFGHGFFSSVCDAMKEDFGPYLNVVVEKAIASLNEEDIVDSESEDDEDDEDSEDEEDLQDEGKKGKFSFRVRTAVLDEKCGAIRALGVYAKHCPNAFAPFLPDALVAIHEGVNYLHESVRQEAVTALHSCVVCACGQSFVDPRLESKQAVVGNAVELLRACIEDDPESTPVAAAIDAAAEIVNGIGDDALKAACIKPFSEMALLVLKKEALCQNIRQEDEDGDEDEEEDAEGSGENSRELAILAAIAELLPALAKAAGASFTQLFAGHFNALMQRTPKSVPESERALVAATIVEVVRIVGTAAADCAPYALPVCLRDLDCIDRDLRCNSVYCAGVLCEIGGAKVAQYYPEFINRVSVLMTSAEPQGDVRDNAIAAAARFLRTPATPIPNREAILQAMLENLPLREDMSEAPTVYGFLCSLLLAGDAAVAPLLPRVVTVFAAAVTNDKTPPETTLEIATTLKKLLDAYPAQLTPLLQALPEATAAHLNALLAAAAPASPLAAAA
eukprot:CAMPEP_0170138518 /NCGR_PEP_ID=MMETSP0033_2-20121228/4984_1 /TAXON_ID=195969 /ORGANISM="Dolichomastix tenuilepis, Strain CCMP3274" /LENGTH=1066 /DNA_ID=CAMNT_0010374539 /DNA_START=11 /DNA_END=3211 /DNA_ORIENTATION=-